MGGFGDIYTKTKSSLPINFMQIVDFFCVCDIMYTYGNVGLFTCGGNMKYKVIGWTNNDDERYPITELDCDEKYDAIVEDIRANNYKFNGWEHHENDSCTPVLNNGKRVCCSQRGFAGLMAYAHNVDNWDGRAYIYYHLTELEDAKYPEAYVDDSAIIKDFPEELEKVPHWDDEVDLAARDNRIGLESRRYGLMNFSSSKFFLDVDEFYTLPAEYDFHAALVASLILERAEQKNDVMVSLNSTLAVLDIMSYWLTEDKRQVVNECFVGLGSKFEVGRFSKGLSELCPDKFKLELRALDGELITVMAFLLKNCYNDKKIIGRIARYLNYLFEYSVQYEIAEVDALVPKSVVEDAMIALKPEGSYLEMKLKKNKEELLKMLNNSMYYLTNDEIIELAVGSVYNEVDKDGVLHLYRCRKEQMEAYKRLSNTLGEWSGRTNGVRLDFVSDSSFFSFKVVVGKKYELFINGKKTDHIELSAGEVFFKELDAKNGENRITLIYPSHETGSICDVALSKGASYRRYKHTYGKKILIIGDSITQGWDTVSDSNSYAYQISLRYDADTVIFGVGGAYFHESILPSEDVYHPDVVIVAFGANDFGRGIDALKKNMPEFLDKLVAIYNNSQIIGLTPISGRAGHKSEKNPFVEFICETYEKYGIDYIDGTDMVAPLEENFADRYHPNDKGYLEMADKLIPMLDKLIK